MIEIRIHGRGGQGVKKAAQILARAAYLSGFKTQDFAIYGAERRGAPVTSFVRIDKKEILTRGYIFNPDYILILDKTIDLNDCIKGIKPDTKIIINSKTKIGSYRYVDATNISLKTLKKPIPNIPILGAFTKLFNKIQIRNLLKAIEIELPYKDVLIKNQEAAKQGNQSLK